MDTSFRRKTLELPSPIFYALVRCLDSRGPTSGSLAYLKNVTPVKLGIAGGPIIMGIIIGALGSRAHFISYTTRSASLMLRKLGLSLYLACLGLTAGKDFLATVIRPEGLLWVGIGLVLTILPLLIIGAIALKTKKFDFGTICGFLCGSMANPMALSYANETIKGERAAVAYTSVYPLGMFLRVIIAQVIIMFIV